MALYLHPYEPLTSAISTTITCFNVSFSVNTFIRNTLTSVHFLPLRIHDCINLLTLSLLPDWEKVWCQHQLGLVPLSLARLQLTSRLLSFTQTERLVPDCLTYRHMLLISRRLSGRHQCQHSILKLALSSCAPMYHLASLEGAAPLSISEFEFCSVCPNFSDLFLLAWLSQCVMFSSSWSAQCLSILTIYRGSLCSY